MELDQSVQFSLSVVWKYLGVFNVQVNKNVANLECNIGIA